MDANPDDSGEKLDEFIDGVRASQRNIVFPDTVRNGRSVDAFLWRGSPNPSPVQRIGAWIFGLVFVAGGLLNAPTKRGPEESWIGTWIGLLLAVLLVLLGIRVFRNGFAKPTKPGQKPS